jgi:hypothetical protein
MTPTPEGQITSTETWNGQAPEVVQEVVQDLDEVIAEADKEEAVEEYDDINSDQA